MRFLECYSGHIKLTKDLPFDKAPSYAILSHTWGPDEEEVTLQDIMEGNAQDKLGYEKIKFCATQAQRDGLRYFWVDSCCIDKRNSTELSEAIISMFKWYQAANRCYVYLSDVSASDPELWKPYGWNQFRESKWFTRGWTLQELLAPSSVEFFARRGRRLGDKKSLSQEIH